MADNQEILSKMEEIETKLEEIETIVNEFKEEFEDRVPKELPILMETLIGEVKNISETATSSTTTVTKRKTTDSSTMKISFKPHKKAPAKSTDKPPDNKAYGVPEPKFTWNTLFVVGVKLREEMEKKSFSKKDIEETFSEWRSIIEGLISTGMHEWEFGCRSTAYYFDAITKGKPAAVVEGFKGLHASIIKRFESPLKCLFDAIAEAKGTTLTQKPLDPYKKEYNAFFSWKDRSEKYNVILGDSGENGPIVRNFYDEFVKLFQPYDRVPFAYNIKKSTANSIDFTKTLFWYLVQINAKEGSYLKKFFSFGDLTEELVKKRIPEALYLEDEAWIKYDKEHPRTTKIGSIASTDLISNIFKNIDPSEVANYNFNDEESVD